MNQRLQRLADQIQRELAVLIRDAVNDPRLTGFGLCLVSKLALT